MDYERDTKNAYLTPTRAIEYKRFNSMDWTCGHFITWLAQRDIARELGRYQWSSTDRLLDIPCGAGILGKTLRRFPFQIVASDISPEMLALARGEYPADRLVDCIQADITATPFPRASFACIIVLSFLHRAPLEIKRAALREIAALSNKVVIVSCSVDTPLQRIKHSVLSLVKRRHVPAPCPAPLNEIVVECEAQGFRVMRAFMVLPPLSSYALLVLEKS